MDVPEAGKTACGTYVDQSGANQMPSEQYNERLTFFDKVFSNGVDLYVHPTGVVGVKLVVDVEASAIDPYRISPYGRAAQSGYVSVFLADSEETAKGEVFQGRPPLQYPSNSWLLRYGYEGDILNIQRIPFEDFKSEFRQASGNLKHEFSQDVRYYLEEKGYTQKFDSIGWVSVQGDQMGQGGFVYNWVSGVQPNFNFLGMSRLDISKESKG
jgi:hypothetical protein